MKSLWRLAGIISYRLSYPLLLVYLRRTHRTRIIIESQGSVVFVEGWLGDGRLCLPGGGLHRGETQLDGIMREVREELGIVVEAASIKELQTFVPSQGPKFRCTLFSAKMKSAPNIRPQHLELLSATWISMHDISSHSLDDATNECLAIWRASSNLVD